MRKVLLKTLALVACLFCSLSAVAAEAYACYTSSNTTLTFYYDNLRSSRTGTTYDLNTGNGYPQWFWDDCNSSITKVVFDPSFAGARPTSCYDWFFSMEKLEKITDIKYLNTSEVTNMSSMFNACKMLNSVDVSGFNTAKVTDMTRMFANCEMMRYLDVSNFNTSNVTDMSQMFWNSGLKNLDLGNFNTAKVTNMAYMFLECSWLESVNLSGFNTAQVTDMRYMFQDCSYLTTIYVGSGWNTNAVTNSNYMFNGCTNIKGEKGTTYDASHVNKAYAHVDGGTSNPGYLSETMPYAVYTSSNTTLTFYYDKYRSSRSGKTYSLNVGDNYPGWYTSGTNASVTKVVFSSSFASLRPTTTRSWFAGMSNLQSITGMKNYLNTSQVSVMNNMFYGCKSLTSLDVSGFNTAQVTEMCFLFYGCEKLTSIDVSNFNTAKVTEMPCMFGYCKSLTSIDVSNFNTAQVTNMIGMFEYCYALTYLDLSNFNTAKVTRMDRMFNNCNTLTSLDLSSFNTTNVESMYSMFDGCIELPSIDVSNFNTAKVTEMGCMFEYCDKLTSLNLRSFNTANVKSMSYMFDGCDHLVNIYVGSGWSTAAVTTSSNMFYGCTSIKGEKGTTYNASHVDKAYAHVDGGTSNPGYLSETMPYAVYTSSNTTLTFYYDKYRDSRSGIKYDLNSGDDSPGWNKDLYCTNVTKVVFNSSFGNARPTTTVNWFSDMPHLVTITGMNYLNTSEVTNMRGMFRYCSDLPSLDVSRFNTSLVTNMCDMFENCHTLTNLNLSNFNTSAVTDMSNMFHGCNNMASLDLSSFNTANVTDMSGMFAYCNGLASLDLSNFNTSQVTNMSEMFSNCQGLTSLNLNNFNTAMVTNMSEMFFLCNKLPKLYLSSFNTSKVTNMYNMFNSCSRLTSILVGSGWSTAAVTSSTGMFSGCIRIKGEKGTTYDVNHLDKAYAHIDGGSSNPGYLSGSEAYAVYTPSNTTLAFYFDKYRSTRTGMTYDLNSETCFPDWYSDGTCESVTRVVFSSSFANALPESTSGWFWEMDNLQTITGLRYLNTSQVTDMEYMFADCSSLTSLDLSNFNTQRVEDMSSMFYNCSSLKSLDVSTFNTEMVKDTYSMFYGCSGLTSLDLRGFNTSRVKDMVYMFRYCSDLTTIFAGSGWSTQAVTSSYDMFEGCIMLRGSKGTAYNASHTDKTYAHIDGGTANPGYLSDILLGDVNGDGVVNIADVTAVIDYILTGDASEINLGAGDVNFDNAVNIADVTTMIDFILTGVW